ncbi:hypothetical protein [Sulfidibacter corallicola]|uniref:Uncharacterized protein n=1 Tax=Sulfidibacter corallicola TaxID=2818388 RepID=A0A8A4TVB2_SULCO|nr:hypothetical protein [Sulfidibacter corallicola]QTD53297.1 hypothetical protein J3U87_12650 [Sulfidibacter corallicola]
MYDLHDAPSGSGSFQPAHGNRNRRTLLVSQLKFTFTWPRQVYPFEKRFQTCPKRAVAIIEHILIKITWKQQLKKGWLYERFT